MPLAHGQPTVIKLHGDYLDARIKNTPEELAKYDRRVNRMLDRILDEYGLLVCGWSAEWDEALRTAMERCKSRRFTTYWCIRGEATDAARRLMQLRAAEAIQITDADQFFTALRQKTQSLATFDPPHPLSVKTAAATMKRLLSEARHEIELHDLVRNELERLVTAISDERMPVSGAIPFTAEEVQKRLRQYEALAAILCSLFAIGCYWGAARERHLWTHGLERLGNRPATGGVTAWISLRSYPALLLLYAGGLGAMARPNYESMKALLLDARLRRQDREYRPVDRLYPGRILDQRAGRAYLHNKAQSYTPLNDHLFEVLREPLRDLLPADEQYADVFDQFEYLFAVSHAALDIAKGDAEPSVPVGRFAWRDRHWREGPPEASHRFSCEADEGSEGWMPVKVGLFRTISQFRSAQSAVDKFVLRLNWD